MAARIKLGWIRLSKELGNVGLVKGRCGISRPALCQWWWRFQAEGEAASESRSLRPHTLPGRKVFEPRASLILELLHEQALKLALDTIHKVPSATANAGGNASRFAARA